MEGKNSISSQSDDGSNDNVEEVGAGNLKQEPKIGDVIWIKLPRSLWWPSVVVDSNFNKSNKSGDKLTRNVRVRIYGSYKYMYVDPFKWHSEFQIILEQNNGCYQEIFRKSLEQDQSGQVKRKPSKSKDVKEPKHHEVKRKLKLGSPNTEKNSKSKSSKRDGKEKQDDTPRKNKHNTPTSDGELSARRTKVMQSLGLIAPSGSPFQKIDAFI